MAILDGVKGLEVWVEVDGKRAEEFWDPTEVSANPKEVRRYIEGVPGKRFSIYEEFKPDFESKQYGQRVVVNIDGVIEEREVIVSESLGRPAGFKSFCNGIEQETQDGKIVFRYFQFEGLNIVEEDITPDELRRFEDALKDVGTITWTCRPVEVIRSYVKIGNYNQAIEQYDHGEVPWKAANNMQLSQSASLASGYTTEKEVDTWLRANEVNPGAAPMATFKFCYRSKDVLKDFKSCSLEPPLRGENPSEDRTEQEPQDKMGDSMSQDLHPTMEVAEKCSVLNSNRSTPHRDIKEEDLDSAIGMACSTFNTGDLSESSECDVKDVNTMTLEELESEANQLQRQKLVQTVIELRAWKKHQKQLADRERQRELHKQNNAPIDLTIDGD